jgi:hypothetical protein
MARLGRHRPFGLVSKGCSMIAKIFDAVFGCWHSQYSFPITVSRGTRHNSPAAVAGTYVVCLECGKELPYDWQRMKVVRPTQEMTNRVARLATKEAA